jgi:putative hemolysin
MFTFASFVLLAQASASEGNLGLQAALVALLIALNAGFAGSEIALVSLREGQVQRLEQGGKAGRALSALARDPNRFLSTIQIGITLAGFLASAAATVTFAQLLLEPLAFLGTAAQPVAILIVTVVLTFLMLVFGELAPKRIALQSSERWGLLAARPLSVLATLAAPVVWLLTKATDLTVRLSGGDPGQAREEMTEQEVRDLVTSQPQFTTEQRTIISGAFEIAERSLREILVPRTMVVGLPADLPSAAGARALITGGHSRAPVYRGSLDDVLGVVHLRDLIDGKGSVSDHMRPATVLPETVGVLSALRRMQSEREQLAVVINEHGGAEGIVTLEDLLEEIVGEIYDEFDRDLDPADVRGVQRRPDGSIVMPGSFPMHDLSDVGIVLPEGDYATVAGMVLERLGRIPAPGAEFKVPHWRIRVLSRLGNAIGSVLLVPEPHEDGMPERGDGPPAAAEG